MKTGLVIKINNLDTYKKANFTIYQQLIGKFMYFTSRTRLDIIFAIEKSSKSNINL